MPTGQEVELTRAPATPGSGSRPSFPDGFVWGAATAAYQIEGAVAEGGRGESIWDRFSHTPGKVRNGDTGDVACDHYHRYADDVAIIAGLGLDAYRFSIAWPRILPTGTGQVSEAGLDFYDRLVDALLARNVVPNVTLYHWDLPQVLEDMGGWPVRATAEAFAGYAAIVARRLGDRVRFFSTLNEPHIISDHGYRLGMHAPGRIDPRAALAAGHHLLIAHALGMAAIRAEAPTASVGLALNLTPIHPASGHPLVVETAAVAHDQLNRWFLDPIVGRGYPEAGVRAWEWDRAEVRDGDMELIAQPIDFLGVNYYSRHVVATQARHGPALDGPAHHGASDIERTAMGWEVYPEGLVEVLEFTRSRTGDLPLYVTENGAAYRLDPSDPTRDPERVSYLRRHLEAALEALRRGIPLRGYFVWSLLDNFEWAQGYEPRFGIVYVDYDTQERRIRDSGRFWAAVAAGAAPAAAESAIGGDAGSGEANRR